MKTLLKIFLLLTLTLNLIGQDVQEGLKRQALVHMNNKKYGEAIDLFNKYISANAQKPEGYNLRALCHQARGMYPNAWFDLLSAIRLEPDNQEYWNNMKKLKEIWHPILYDKIEGHKREIAIDPDYPFNYLEIGKSFRWLEEWLLAEYWYDEYLARDDDASADEIIRYTLILTENRHIEKGEKILKKYVERYPEDWRLWSRYGYFTLWLGKYKIAETAFLNALSFKPYFKEAQDGLDLARRKGYVTLQDDDDDGDDWRYKQKEYPIDRYYRIVRNDPTDYETRFKLIQELLAVSRYEEANEQLRYLKSSYEGEERFEQLWTQLMLFREKQYTEKLDEYLIRLKNDPTDKEAVKESAAIYAGIEKYDEADEILSEFLDLVPDDYDILRLRAKYFSWNKKGEEAFQILEKVLELDPFNREVVDELSDYYAAEYEYDTSIEILNNFLQRFDESQELDLRYKAARLQAWNYNWDDARDNIVVLMNNNPDNLDYQLLAGQIIVWTVDTAEYDLAESYFLNVLASDETNLSALIGMVSIKTWLIYLEEAKIYLDLAKKYHGTSSEIETAENFYNTQLLVMDEVKYMKLREEANDYLRDGDCAFALEKMQDYFSYVDNPDDLAYLQMASSYVCLEDYSSAIDIYDELLSRNYTFDAAMERAKAYLYNRDTASALQEFNNLVDERPDDFYARMFLGDTYLMSEEYGDADDIYYELLDETTDESQKELINDRINLIPLYGFNRSFSGLINFMLPYNFSVRPSATYYDDNQDLSYYSYGGKVEMGFARYFSGGLDYKRTRIDSKDPVIFLKEQNLTSLTFNLYMHFNEYITIGAGLGTLNIQYEDTKRIGMAMARFEKKDHFGISFNYEDDDARRILYSPKLLGTRLDAYFYNLNAFYEFEMGFKFETFYRYIRVSDGNEGNDFQIRFGKRFQKDFIFGYEYAYADFRYDSTAYYSPQSFDTHSIWGKWHAYYLEPFDISVGGKIGYAPNVDFVLSSIYGDAKYEIVDNLFLNGIISYGNSFRFDSSYQYISAILALGWSFF